MLTGDFQSSDKEEIRSFLVARRPGALLRPPLPRRHTTMAVHSSLSSDGLPFFRRIPFAVLPERPSPPGRHHHCLEVIVTSKALRHWAMVSRV
jgi:hypothetical protein